MTTLTLHDLFSGCHHHPGGCTGRFAGRHGAVAALIRACACLVLLVLLCACADPGRHAAALAQPAALLRQQISTDPFVLTAFVRISRPDQPLSVYIEGDGRAWLNRNTPSDDPTPHQALGLALAASDPASNVLYLARPCQFTPMEQNPRCSESYWTSKRFAPEVIQSLDQAISHYARQLPGQRLHLVGYSGGGAVAVLIAARRHDVASLRTVAGNLDHNAVNQLHQVSLMPESENAIDVATRVAAIPQIHFSGADDHVVPATIARQFARAAGGHCVQTVVVPAMSHASEWQTVWPGLLAQAPRCRAAAVSCATLAALPLYLIAQNRTIKPS
jgi:dienelactone hydrolase